MAEFHPLVFGDVDPASQTTAWSATEVEQLLTLPVTQTSVAMQVATVIRPATGQRVEIPIVMDDGKADPGIVAEGGEVPLIGDPTAGVLRINHTKIAARAQIGWETLRDNSFDVAGLYGNAIVNKIVSTIDRAFFDESTPAAFPMLGVGQASDIHTMSATLTNLDPFLDAITFTQIHGAPATAFVASPNTVNTIAKMKESTVSERPLIGTTDQPLVSTIAGLPLHACRFVPDTTIWAIPQSRAVVSMRQDVTLQTDPTAHFSTMEAGVVGSMRIGFGFPDQASIVKMVLS